MVLATTAPAAFVITTLAFASVEPVILGVVLEVISSEDETPVSDDALKSAVGVVISVSIIISSVVDAVLPSS